MVNDVERWSEWTASIRKIERLGSGQLGRGSQARRHQPRFPVLVWKVTEYEPGSGFTWEVRTFGAHTIGEHWIERKSANLCTVRLKIIQRDFLVPILAPFMNKITRDYMNMEAQGLKSRCEPGLQASA